MNLKEIDFSKATEVIKVPEIPESFKDDETEKTEKDKKKKKKEKKKKSLWESLFKKSKLKKPNTVAVIFLRNNGIAEPMEITTRNGFFNIYGKTYHENRDCVYSLTKDRIPFVIIPEWSLIPLGTKRWENKSMLEKFAELQDHALKGIRHAELVKMGEAGEKGKLSAKAIIGFIILALIGYAIFTQFT